MAVSFICGGNRSTRRKPPSCRKSLTNFITWYCIEYTSPWTGFGFTILVMIATADSGEGRTRRAPPKFGKNKIFWRKIVIFHTKYPKYFRIFFKIRSPNLKSWIRPWIGTDCTGSCKSNYHTITTKHNRETIVNFEPKSSRQYHIWSSVRKWHYFSTNCWQLPRNFLKAKMGLFLKNPWRTNLF